MCLLLAQHSRRRRMASISFKIKSAPFSHILYKCQKHLYEKSNHTIRHLIKFAR